MNYYYIQNGFIHFNFKFDTELIASIKQITGRVFNPETKEWYVPLTITNGTPINTIITKFKFEKRDHTSLLGEKSTFELEKVDPIEMGNLKKELLNKGLGISPRGEFQWEGIYWMSVWGNMILGDLMGLGKSPQTIFTAELNDWFPCLVICPSSTKYQWRDLWLKANPKRNISVIDSGKKVNNFDSEVVIINWEMLGETDGTKILRGKEVNNVTPKFKELLKGWKYCVLDEIHYGKSVKSNRAQIALKVTNKSKYVVGLSGTLTVNKTSEIIHPLRLIKQFNKLFGNWDNFVKRYCNAKKTPFGWDTSGSSNLFELNEILRKNCYLRREKSDVKKDLPPTQETYYWVELSNKKEYLKAQNDIISFILKKYGEEKLEALMGAEMLVQRTQLKQLSIKGKIKAIKQWIDDYLENTDEKLMVAGVHTEPLVILSTHYKCELLNGSVNSLKKREMVQRFEKSKDRILFAQMKAVGTGTDGLQNNCSNMLIIELPDTPAERDQLVSRLDRDGQQQMVSVNYILCKESVDIIIKESLEVKQVTTKAINKGVDHKEEEKGKTIKEDYL